MKTKLTGYFSLISTFSLIFMPSDNECTDAIALTAASAWPSVSPVAKSIDYFPNIFLRIITYLRCTTTDKCVQITLKPNGRISCSTNTLSGGSGVDASVADASANPDLYLVKKHFGTSMEIG